MLVCQCNIYNVFFLKKKRRMVVLIWLLQHSCTNIKIENDFLVEISKCNFCRVKNLLKKRNKFV